MILLHSRNRLMTYKICKYSQDDAMITIPLVKFKRYFSMADCSFIQPLTEIHIFKCTQRKNKNHPCSL